MRRNMWANAAVVSLPEIAVHAENLIAGRIPGVSQMIQHGTAAASSVADCPPKRTPVIGTVVVHVIQGQKPRFRLATTSANIPAIRHDRFVPDLLPVIAATLSLFRGPRWIFAVAQILQTPVLFQPLLVRRAILALIFQSAGLTVATRPLAHLGNDPASSARFDHMPSYCAWG